MKKQLGLRREPDMVSNGENAISYSRTCIKAKMVILGDDCKFWVCCPADASRLNKLGYEYAL